MPDVVTQQGSNHRAAILVAGVVGVLVAATLALWFHFGTAVFYEMIVAGIAACF